MDYARFTAEVKRIRQLLNEDADTALDTYAELGSQIIKAQSMQGLTSFVRATPSILSKAKKIPTLTTDFVVALNNTYRQALNMGSLNRSVLLTAYYAGAGAHPRTDRPMWFVPARRGPSLRVEVFDGTFLGTQTTLEQYARTKEHGSAEYKHYERLALQGKAIHSAWLGTTTLERAAKEIESRFPSTNVTIMEVEEPFRSIKRQHRPR